MSEVLQELISKWIQANAPTYNFISKPLEEEYEDLKGYIPEDLKIKFKIFCTRNEVTMCAVIYHLIREWIEAQIES